MIFALLFSLNVLAAPDSKTDLSRFRQILKDVGTNSPSVLLRNEQQLALESQALESKLSWTPSLSASISKSLPGSDIEQKTAAVKASLNLFRFGGDLASLQAGRRATDQAELRRALAVLDVQKQTAQLLFRWISLQRQLESQKDLSRLKERLVTVAQERFRRGQLPEQDVEKVRLDQKNSEVQVTQSEVDLISLRGQLEALLPGSSALRDWPWLHVIGAASGPKAKSLEQRKEFLALALDVDVNRFRRQQATAGLLPSLDLGASWQTDQIEPLGRGVQQSLLTLTIPLWDQGHALSTRGYYLHQQLAAENDLERFKRDELQRLKSLDERRSLLQKIAMTARESSRRARALSEQSVLRFQLGRSSVNDLLIDQQRLFQADTLAQETLRNYHETLLEACLAADEEPADCY